jgi:hypothetical protein
MKHTIPAAIPRQTPTKVTKPAHDLQDPLHGPDPFSVSIL